MSRTLPARQILYSYSGSSLCVLYGGRRVIYTYKIAGITYNLRDYVHCIRPTFLGSFSRRHYKSELLL